MMLLALVYAILAGLLLWFVVGSKGKWLVKLLVIAGTLSFSYFAYSAIGSTDGWPTRTQLPARALFVSGEVIQPLGSKPGRIYLWLISPTHTGIFGYSPRDMEPRAYVVDYTPELQNTVEQALALAAQGQEIELRAGPSGKRHGNHPSGSHPGHPGRQHGRSGSSASSSSSRQHIGIYILPKPSPPQKK